MKLSSVMVRCGHCGGLGEVPLTGVYLETLLGVRRLCKSYGHVVANRDAKLFACTPTALNNRLAALERRGLLTSEKYGRQRRFSVAPSGEGTT